MKKDFLILLFSLSKPLKVLETTKIKLYTFSQTLCKRQDSLQFLEVYVAVVHGAGGVVLRVVGRRGHGSESVLLVPERALTNTVPTRQILDHPLGVVGSRRESENRTRHEADFRLRRLQTCYIKTKWWCSCTWLGRGKWGGLWILPCRSGTKTTARTPAAA